MRTEGAWDGAFAALAGWGREQGREPVGGIRRVLVPRSPNPPDSELAVALRPF